MQNITAPEAVLPAPPSPAASHSPCEHGAVEDGAQQQQRPISRLGRAPHPPSTISTASSEDRPPQDVERHVFRKSTLDLEGNAGRGRRRKKRFSMKNSGESGTPFGMNCYILLAIVVLYAALVGAHFFNWTPWEKILLTNGAFADRCNDNSWAPCSAQTEEVRGLLPIVTVSMFSFTFLAGLLLDIIGPKICCLIGTCFLIAGWGLLACTSLGVNTYKLGFFLMGAGTDPAFFGTLCVANLFPGYNSTIIAMLGSARSVSNLWPYVLNEISSPFPGFTFPRMAILFSGVYVACLAVVLLLIPYQPYSLPETSQPTPSTGGGEDGTKGGTDVKRIQSCVSNEGASSTAPASLSLKQQLQRLWTHSSNPLYLPIIGLCIANILRNNFYLTSAATQLGPAEPFLSLVNVLTFIPGPILGLIVDKYGPLCVLVGVNTTNSLVFVVLLLGPLLGSNSAAHDAMRYMSVILAFPGIGFLLNQVYCYIAVYFPQADMGKLAGFACFVAGICGLVVTPMTTYAERIHSFWEMNLVNIVLSFIAYALIGFLIWKHRSSRAEEENKAETGQSYV